MTKDEKKNPNSDPSQALAPLPECPTWADRLIKEMLAIEVRLGNLQPENEDSEEWKSDDLDQIYQRLDSRAESSGIDEAAVESLFKQIATGLSGEGFDLTQIARTINARMVNRSKLPYCDENEVEDALRNPIH